ncbi:MAG TPA: hypothetical protein VGO78_05010 [Acidimicrobiales bacterium]|nr:hypothetical protein [Acidimicrobiales bacterium]
MDPSSGVSAEHAANLGDLGEAVLATGSVAGEQLQAGIRDHYLPRYQVIAAEAAPEDRDVTAFMVRHETALLEVVTAEATGQVETSLAPLDDHLRFPLPPPPH